MSRFSMTMREPNLQAIQTGIRRNSNRQLPQKKRYGSAFKKRLFHNASHQEGTTTQFRTTGDFLCSRRNHLEAFFEACDYPALGLDPHRDAGPTHWCAFPATFLLPL